MKPDYVEQLRLRELERAFRWLPKGQRILELGAGTGWQARRLTELGHDVEAVDIPEGDYTSQRIWPVRDYDGVNLPFADESFDIVFSSNVLEHVENLPALLKEAIRVVRPGGHLVHVVPSATWRFWTTLTYYPDLPRRALSILGAERAADAVAEPDTTPAKPRKRNALRALVPPAHGLLGSVWTELWYFRRQSWLRRLASPKVIEISASPGGIFYSGTILFGSQLPLAWRERLARALGSSTHIIVCEKGSS